MFSPIEDSFSRNSYSFITSATFNVVLLILTIVLFQKTERVVVNSRSNQLVFLEQSHPPLKITKVVPAEKQPVFKDMDVKSLIIRKTFKDTPPPQPIAIVAQQALPVISSIPAPRVVEAQQPKIAGFGVPTNVSSNSEVNLPRGSGLSTTAISSAGFGHTSRQSASPTLVVQKTAFGVHLKQGAESRMTISSIPETPLVILYKPTPEYTEIAKKKKIQGDVELSVIFKANGSLDVLRIVSGLGYGLDEQAQLAAKQIRFKPATKNGTPCDVATIIKISFMLA